MKLQNVKNIFSKINEAVVVQNISSVLGGDINVAIKVATTGEDYFIKYNSATKHPKMFEVEVNGLELINSRGGFNTPKIIAFGEEEKWSYLVLSWEETINETEEIHKRFGEKLAQMHRASHHSFGLDHNNYMGSLTQKNKSCKTWTEFFITMRLEPQLKLGRDSGSINPSLASKMEKLFGYLENWLPQEKPALLHGDLWSGNYLATARGPLLIDPAVYFGHREIDIAMMHLFGGFHPQIFDAYNDQFPLERGWEKRLDLHNLYPLLIHVNLFGGSYLRKVESTLNKYI